MRTLAATKSEERSGEGLWYAAVLRRFRFGWASKEWCERRWWRLAWHRKRRSSGRTPKPGSSSRRRLRVWAKEVAPALWSAAVLRRFRIGWASKEWCERRWWRLAWHRKRRSSG